MGVLRALHDVHPTMSFPDGIYGCSIGCVFALATAFRVDLSAMETVYDTYFGIDGLLPYATLDNLQTLPETHGFLPMDGYLDRVVQGFLAMGLDLRTKVMADAPQPLYFLAANMTRQRSVFLTGQVPILEALACSGCIPLVFRPRVLYGEVYLDGGVFVRCIGTVVPPTTFVAHVSGVGCALTPDSGVDDILAAIYGGPRFQYHAPNILRICAVHISILSELSREEKKELAQLGYSRTRAFLAKRFPKELKESGGGSLPLVGPEQ